MSQKVKLQISSDLEDVTKISSITLEDALANISALQLKVLETKRSLYGLDLGDELHRKQLKSLLSDMDLIRTLLSKIDMRVGDVASVIGGLDDIFEGKMPQKEESKDDNVSTG
jgi:hypothetical protein